MQERVNLAANVAVVEEGKILLMQREDFEVWCLPGGMVDTGESLAQAAVREAREETGLEVALERLVGVYSRTDEWFGSHVVCFAARKVGGVLQAQPEECIGLGYFAPAALPEDMFWWHRQQVVDAFAGAGGSSAWNMRIHPAEKYGSRQELYALRDRSGLSPVEFYRRFYESGGTDEVEREV